MFLKCIILVTMGYPPPAPLNLQFWWAEFGQIVFFQADYDEFELQKINYDIILVT